MSFGKSGTLLAEALQDQSGRLALFATHTSGDKYAQRTFWNETWFNKAIRIKCFVSRLITLAKGFHSKKKRS